MQPLRVGGWDEEARDGKFLQRPLVVNPARFFFFGLG